MVAYEDYYDHMERDLENYRNMIRQLIRNREDPTYVAWSICKAHWSGVPADRILEDDEILVFLCRNYKRIKKGVRTELCSLTGIDEEELLSEI